MPPKKEKMKTFLFFKLDVYFGWLEISSEGPNGKNVSPVSCLQT
jgi:hypothetical protein